MSSQGVILQYIIKGIFYKVIHKTATFDKHIPFDLFQLIPTAKASSAPETEYFPTPPPTPNKNMKINP